MERLTTNNPKNNTDTAMNLFYVKDGQTWVRGGGPEPDYQDCTLYDYIRSTLNGVMALPGMPIREIPDEEIGELMTEWLMDGHCSISGLVAHLYTAAWAFAELRERLKKYEDTGLEPDTVSKIRDVVLDVSGDIDHLRELVQSEKNGQLVVLPCKEFYEKIGDYLYLVYGGEVTEVLHGGAEVDVNGKPTIIVITEDDIFPWREPIAEFDTDPTDWCVNTEVVTSDDFGKTVFLTREEAEAALGGGTNEQTP